MTEALRRDQANEINKGNGKRISQKEKSIEQKRSSIGHYYLRLYQLYRFFYLSSLSFHGSGILSVPELVGLQKEYDYTNHHRIYLLLS